MFKYKFSAFLASFLLFQLEFIFSKALLPVFGGTYLIWAACMMFFQGILLLGYLSAHLGRPWIGNGKYSNWYPVLMALAFFTLPFRFEKFWDYNLTGRPLPALIRLLAANCALVFFILSTVSIVLQDWLQRSDLKEAKNPYVLYSASNLGAICALLTYPFFFEPAFSLKQQGNLWWTGYLVLFFACLACLPGKIKRNETIQTAENKVNPGLILQWLWLSLAGCFTLLSVTNLLTFEIAVVPFLWCLPLSVYLLSFVLVFKRRPWHPQWLNKAFGWAVVVGIMQYLMSLFRMGLPAALALMLELMILFVVCINCHAKLAELKPAGNKLTLYYFILGIGGFAASLLVSIVIPLVTKSLLEYPASFFLASISLNLASIKNSKSSFSENTKTFLFILATAFTLLALPLALSRGWAMPAKILMIWVTFITCILLRLAQDRPWRFSLLLFCILLFSQWTEQFSLNLSNTFKSRNFYGINYVYDLENERFLQHGTTIHGRQYLSGPKAGLPLAYFHPSTPAGKLLSAKAGLFNSSAMMGLGTGALSMYFKSGQSLTIYELDPEISRIANDYFSYLKLAKEKGVILNYVFGDGRISLRKAPAAIYDLLIIDVFNNDSIPPHLLTLEAIREYKRVLKPKGLLLMHVSNRIFDLKPVIYAAAQKEGFKVFENTIDEDAAGKEANACTWMALCIDTQDMEDALQKFGWKTEIDKLPRPWTDQYVNLLSALKQPFLPSKE